jgi:hypothetical protein
MQNYNFACCCLWVCDLVVHIEGGTKVEGVRVYGPKRGEVTEVWGRLNNEELNDLYCSPNIVRVIKSRRMGWAGHAAHTGKRRKCIQGFDGET